MTPGDVASCWTFFAARAVASRLPGRHKDDPEETEPGPPMDGSPGAEIGKPKRSNG